jgi:hypothetical protein
VKPGAKVTVGILAAIGLVAVGASVLAPFMSECTTQKISSVASPSGERIAEHYQTVCKSETTPKTEIHLVQDGTRVSTVIGSAAVGHIELAWKDERSLLVPVPAGMEKAFDRPMQGINLEFQVVDDAAHLTPNKTMEPTR